MVRMRSVSVLGAAVLALVTAPAHGGDEAKPAPKEADAKAPSPDRPVSFLKDVAPVLLQNCVACHNSKKSEGKFILTTFAQLAKGGQQGEGITLEPGDPDASYLVELIRPDGQPRMPYKLDPLPPEQVALIERWVREGAKYDGTSPDEDWISVLRKATPVAIPERYPVPVPVTGLAFGPDGREVVASGYHELTLWNADDGTLTRRIPGLPERIYDVAFSPDGRWMATAGGDPGQFGAVQLWIAEPEGGGKPVRDLVESSDCQFAVAFSPDSRLLAAAGADRAVRVWEVASGKLLTTMEDHADWILDVAFSPDGQRVATASRDKTAKVFDVVKHEALVTFPNHAEAVYGVVFLPDGKAVASAGGDQRIRIWGAGDEGKQRREIGGFGGPVFRLQLTPDGKQLVACGADKVVRIFDPNNGSAVRTLNGHNDWVYAVAVSSDGKTLASGAWDGEVRLWNLADGKPRITFRAAPGWTSSSAKP